jgi:hypothetical protein
MTALINSGFSFKFGRTMINLAPVGSENLVEAQQYIAPLDYRRHRCERQ